MHALVEQKLHIGPGSLLIHMRFSNISWDVPGKTLKSLSATLAFKWARHRACTSLLKVFIEVSLRAWHSSDHDRGTRGTRSAVSNAAASYTKTSQVDVHVMHLFGTKRCKEMWEKCGKSMEKWDLDDLEPRHGNDLNLGSALCTKSTECVQLFLIPTSNEVQEAQSRQSNICTYTLHQPTQVNASWLKIPPQHQIR